MTIVLTGPESTAKSTLAEAVVTELTGGGASAEGFAGKKPILVPEYAREYVAALGRSYLPSDLLRIAVTQATHEHDAATSLNLVIADTDIQVITIWWREKYGALPRTLIQLAQAMTDKFYLLCQPDIPWSEDPLRENPLDRDRLFNLYRDDLEQRGVRYGIVHGNGDARVQCAINLIRDAGRG